MVQYVSLPSRHRERVEHCLSDYIPEPLDHMPRLRQVLQLPQNSDLKTAITGKYKGAAPFVYSRVCNTPFVRPYELPGFD